MYLFGFFVLFFFLQRAKINNFIVTSKKKIKKFHNSKKKSPSIALNLCRKINFLKTLTHLPKNAWNPDK